MDCDVSWLRTLVRQIDDFPEPGVRYADITPVLADADALRCIVELIADEFVGREIDAVAGIDARGFILGGAIACRLGCGFVPIRKAGRLPAAAHRVSYALEYGTGELELHTDAVSKGDRVVVVDDVLATGGTARAALELMELAGATVEGLAFMLAIAGLNGAESLTDPAPIVVLGEL